MSPQKNQSGEIVRSVWKQLFVKYGLYKSQWVQILYEGGLIFRIYVSYPTWSSNQFQKNRTFKIVFYIFFAGSCDYDYFHKIKLYSCKFSKSSGGHKTLEISST